MTDYKDKFTYDGRLHPQHGVTRRKTLALKELFEAGRRGDRIAAAKFAESISSSDAIFNAAHLANLQALPQFDKLARTWQTIASVRVVPDFRPAVLYDLYFNNFEGLKRDDAGANNPAGIIPVVPEGAPYPYATIGSTEAAYESIAKRGFKVGWTWEARINDAIGFFEQIPPAMIVAAGDTEEWLVYSALVNGVTSASQLAGGTIYSGQTVVANAPFSRNALIRLIFEISQRKVNGRPVPTSGGFNLIVANGLAPWVRFELSQQIIQASDGAFTLSVEDQAVLGGINVVEDTSGAVTGSNWYLVPKPGSLSRPVLDLGRLRGYESPEIRVNNATGDFLGGASVAPFEGSFDNDSIDLRLRYPLGGILWSEIAIGWSTGAGT